MNEKDMAWAAEKLADLIARLRALAERGMPL